MKKIALLTLCIIQSLFTKNYAQELVAPNVIGENHIFYSEILNEDREITIYTPENYKETKTAYPVLYILDGQRYFLNGVLYQNTLHWQDKIPDFIVVGITTNNRKRRKLFFEEAKTFVHFLEWELIPYIDKKYRTSSKRMFFGWEMAGGFAVELLGRPKNLFSAYFIASPTHITDTRLQSLKEKLMANKDAETFIYFTLSPSETWSEKSVEKLNTLLKENALQKSNWTYQSLTDENHHSTPTITIHQGLNKYFNDYAYLRFNNLKEFDDFGGMDMLKVHYKERGEKYNTPTAIHKSTIHFLLLQAMKEDNYEAFELFMEAFGDYYKTKTRDLWFNRYAQFYLKHQNANKAIEVLTTGLEKFPDSPIILSSLGDAFLKKGDTITAKTYYNKALELATEKNDTNIENYKSKLKQVQM